MLRPVALFSCAWVAGCAPASVELEFGPAPSSYGYIFSSGACRLASDEAECRIGDADGFTIALTPNEAAEPGTCRFDLSITVDCDAPSPNLLQGTVEAAALQSPAPTQVELDTFNRTFDDDGDSYSNYVEWAEGTALDDAASVPADRSQDLQ